MRSIEFLGLKVIAAMAESASTIRCFFRLHDLCLKTMPHMTKNPYASEEHHIYYFSDVPHLLKSARNGLTYKQNMDRACG